MFRAARINSKIALKWPVGSYENPGSRFPDLPRGKRQKASSIAGLGHVPIVAISWLQEAVTVNQIELTMKRVPLRFCPTRHKDAFVRELGTELLVIVPESKKAHCLNETAGKIWMLCNGDNTVLDIASFLSQEFDYKVDAQVVWMALAELQKAKLLVSLPSFPERPASASRRELLRKMGMSVALALPVVASIVIPSPAAAASCGGPGATCMTNAACCSGRCNNGGHCAG
ncbi:MAG: hypothetical protein QOD84_2543 [Acidobacteriaceae bacterium]